MKSRDIEAISKLNNILPNLPVYNNAIREIKDNVQILVQGINELDQEVKQKTFEVQNREQLLAQRDHLLVQKDSVINQKTAEVQNTKQVLAQKEKKLGEFTKTEFADSLHKLYPDTYSTDPSQWFYKDGRGPLPMKVHYDTNNIQVMEKNINFYKERLTEKEQEDIKKKFISSLHERYPDTYSTDPSQWFFKTGEKAGEEYPMKTHYDKNNFYVMVKNTKFYQKEIEEINAKKLEEAKRLKEEDEARKEQSLNDQAQELARVKELLSIKDIEAQTKDQLILAKELENQKLLIQKEEEVHNKSLIKNQVIDLKEKDALNLKIELLTKQLEFKDRALEDAHEIAKQKQIVNELKEKELADARAINELQGKLLDLKALYGHDISFSEQFSAIQFRVENSIANNDFDDIADLSRYISRLVEAERDNSASIDISDLLANISPISPINSVQHPVAVVNNGNFDIDNQHITHSVLLNGEGSESFEII